MDDSPRDTIFADTVSYDCLRGTGANFSGSSGSGTTYGFGRGWTLPWRVRTSMRARPGRSVDARRSRSAGWSAGTHSPRATRGPRSTIAWAISCGEEPGSSPSRSGLTRARSARAATEASTASGTSSSPARAWCTSHRKASSATSAATSICLPANSAPRSWLRRGWLPHMCDIRGRRHATRAAACGRAG